MLYLKSTLAGIGGSIMALILLLVVLSVLNRDPGMVGINILGPLPILVAALGFILAFYFVYKISN
jgi:hypothetical protein